MKYINRLEEENKELKDRLARLDELVREFRTHLTLPKFQGPENDWINVRDVDTRLLAMMQETTI